MNDINTYEDLQTIIDSKTGDLQNLHLELENLNIKFDLQLDKIYEILRHKAIAEHNQNLTDKDKILSYDGIISINFISCKFQKLYCWNIPENQILELNITNGSIEELNILNSKILGKFYINKQYGTNKQNINITKLIIKDTIFHENFKLHYANVTEITIEDTDFEKHADFFKSTFEKGTLEDDISEQTHKDEIGFKAINFKGLALFGDTEFKKKLIFKYVTFESFSHFRKAKLNEGLDLDYSNIQNEMNFFDVQKLDTKEAKTNTSQETFRIIKHNFNKIGNIIEANKYHSLELKRHRNTLKVFSSDFFNYIVLFFHWITSNHSKNWVLPIFWIFVVGSLTYFSLNQFICFRHGCSDNLIDIFKYISIINYDDCIKRNPVIFILNKISLGYLYYQFITAIRKDTRK